MKPNRRKDKMNVMIDGVVEYLWPHNGEYYLQASTDKERKKGSTIIAMERYQRENTGTELKFLVTGTGVSFKEYEYVDSDGEPDDDSKYQWMNRIYLKWVK